MTLDELYRQTKSTLQKAGVDAPVFDALCLFEEVFDLDRHGLIMRGAEEADGEKSDLLNSLAKRRAEGEPLQYILGKWEFMGNELFVGRGVLIPREDTICVVEAAIDALKSGKNLHAVDLCSGTGAIAIAIAKTLDCSVVAVELYDQAFSYLEKNIKHSGCDNVKPLKADVLTDFHLFPDNSLDLIISNPPYIERDDIPTLQKEVQFEPKTALDGGTDGLDFYSSIVKNWGIKLKSGGVLCFELGEGQFDDVRHMMQEYGFEKIGFAVDFGNIRRCIYGYKI